MSYIYTWLAVICGAVIAHALGLEQSSASIVIVVSGAALLAHRLGLFLYSLSEIDDGVPHPELHAEFVRRYFDACNSSQPNDWMQAALAAKRWENAVAKPAKHTALRGVSRRPA